MTKIKISSRVVISPAIAGDISLSAARRGVRGATSEADAFLVDILSQPGQGETYDTYFFTDASGTVRPGKKRAEPHTASAPGDAPAVDSGDLRRNRSQEITATPSGAIGELSVDMEYAEALELGTEKIEPRPFMSRLISKYTERIIDAFVRSAGIR